MIIKKIDKILLYYYLRGDIDLKNFKWDCLCEDDYIMNIPIHLGYNIYDISEHALLKSNRIYEINIDPSGHSLFKFLNNNRFITNKYELIFDKNVKFVATPADYIYFKTKCP